jgi:hypothetical protein
VRCSVTSGAANFESKWTFSTLHTPSTAPPHPAPAPEPGQGKVELGKEGTKEEVQGGWRPPTSHAALLCPAAKLAYSIYLYGHYGNQYIDR